MLVEVRDAGPGLAPTTASRVFEAFYTTKPGGLGSARLEPSSVSRADFVIASFDQNALEWRQVCAVSGHSGVLDRTAGSTRSSAPIVGVQVGRSSRLVLLKLYGEHPGDYEMDGGRRRND